MVYLIISNSYHILDEEVGKIFKSLDDVEIINYNDTSLEEIINLASYTSLFNYEKKMIIKNFDLSSNKNELLEKYIENQNPLSQIIFLCNEKVDERKKVVKLLKERNTYTYIKPLTYKDINQRLIDKCKKNGFKLQPNDASFITFESLSNYDIAIEELNKVFLYYINPCEIKREDLNNIISHNIDDNNFKFIDAVIQRDIKTSMNLIKNLKLFKVEPLGLLSLLSREYRLMLFTKQMLDEGLNQSQIARELSLFDWQVNKLINNSYSYTNLELENKLLDLSNLDYELKVGNIDKYLGLEMFILKG